MIRWIIFVVIFISLVSYGNDALTELGKETKPVPEEKRILPPEKPSSSYSRLCLKDDIIGFWKVVKWTPYFYIPAKDWNKPLYLKYQWFWFFDNGTFGTMASKKELQDSDVKNKLTGSPTDLQYKFVDKGIIDVFHRTNERFKEVWRCALVTEDIAVIGQDDKVEKGDILMSLLDANNTVIYVRQMRKVK